MNSTTSDTAIKQPEPNKDESTLRKYAHVVIGSDSIPALLSYEILCFFLTGMPGALGILFRRLLYRKLFKNMGKNVTISRNICIRGGMKISLGNNVLIDEGCVLDARGPDASICIEDNVLISGGTVIRARNGHIRIGKGSSIGRNCLLGTDHLLELGEDVLLGAYDYLTAGAMHRFDMPDVPIIKQGFVESVGISIGKGSWIGTKSTVLDGNNVGDYSVIGAHSLVTTTIPSGSVAYGCPAKLVRSRLQHST